MLKACSSIAPTSSVIVPRMAPVAFAAMPTPKDGEIARAVAEPDLNVAAMPFVYVNSRRTL